MLNDWAELLETKSNLWCVVFEQHQQVNDRLRHLGGTSKLVLDVLTFDDVYRPAMLSICGYVFSTSAPIAHPSCWSNMCKRSRQKEEVCLDESALRPCLLDETECGCHRK